MPLLGARLLDEGREKLLEVKLAGGRCRWARASVGRERADPDHEQGLVHGRLQRDVVARRGPVEQDGLDRQLQIVHLVEGEVEPGRKAADQEADDAVEAPLVRDCEGQRVDFSGGVAPARGSMRCFEGIPRVAEVESTGIYFGMKLMPPPVSRTAQRILSSESIC